MVGAWSDAAAATLMLPLAIAAPSAEFGARDRIGVENCRPRTSSESTGFRPIVNRQLHLFTSKLFCLLRADGP